jgi:hypothetical protein
MVSHGMGDKNLLSRTPPCFGRHVKQLVPAAFAVVYTHSLSRRVDVRAIVKWVIAESLSQHDGKHVVPTSLSGIRVGRREEVRELHVNRKSRCKKYLSNRGR